MTTDYGFGDPKHTSDRKTFPEGPKKGVQEHRILPPILNQRQSGKYVHEHTCHYGYGVKLQGSDKERPNPFYCVEEGKWVSGKFVVTQECPECRAIKAVKAQVERITVDMKKAGASDDAIKAATESQDKWLRKHNRDFKQYVNVKDSAGRYFTAKYPQKEVWKKIKAIIEEYKNRRSPIDAIAASQGLWFRITRSGDGFKTEYAVEVVTEDVVLDGKVIEGAQRPKPGPLTAEDAKKASEACMDIGDVGIRRLSVEQVQRLVSSKGDPNIIAAVFAASDPTSQAAGPAPMEESPLPDEEPAAAPVESLPPVQAVEPPIAGFKDLEKAVVIAVTAPSSGTQDPTSLLAQARALMEQARAMEAGKAAPAAAPAAPTPAATPPAPKPAPQPVAAPAPTAAPTQPAPAAASSSAEDDFLKQFELPA